MSLRGGSGRNRQALGPRLSCAVRALSLLVTRRPHSFCFSGMPGLLIALRFRVASRLRASRGGVWPLLTGPDRPPAFCDRVRRLPFDEPNDQLTPRQSGDDPGVLPVEPVLWPGQVLAGQPSSPGGPRSGQRSTGRQYPVTGCTPVSVPSTSVPRLAHRPSVHMRYAPSESATGQYPGRLTGPQYPSLALSCPTSRALFDADGQVCTDRSPSRLGPVHSDIRVPSDSPFQFDVSPLAVARSRPATDHI
jgi:hypothetical protein